MPDPKNYSTKDDWLDACIPQLISEGNQAAQAVAICQSMWDERDTKKVSDTPQVAYIGDTVKALGNGRIGGYLVRFGSQDDTDLVGDYFTKETEFGTNTTPPLLYAHGFDQKLKTRIIGKGEWKPDDTGLWYEAQLNERDEYEQMIYALVEAGKLGYSSGAVSHLVEIETGKSANFIKTWIIGEASLTTTPAEYRNHVIPVKSLSETILEIPEHPEHHNCKTQPIPAETKAVRSEPTQPQTEAIMPENTNSITMTEEQLKTLIDSSVETALKALPADQGGSHVEVTKDEGDQPWVKPGDFFKAVKMAAYYPHEVDPRLAKIKATGMSEGVPADGGYLVPQEVSSTIIERMLATGEILSRVSMDPVSGNSMLYNGIDETTHVGSLYGGIVGYWLNEGGTKTASKPKFYQLDLKLKKVAALCYATDEQLEDTANLESWITRTVPNVLRFYAEDAIIEGDGVGKPLGIMNSPALISLLREDASEINFSDVANMWGRRWVGTPDYIWLVNPSAAGQLPTLAVGTTPVYIPPGGASATPYAMLFGKPVIETEYCQALGTAGDIVLASLSQYQAISKGSVKSDTSIHVAFTTDETAFRFVYRIDGAPSWHSALTPLHGSTVSPFVTLSAASV